MIIAIVVMIGFSLFAFQYAKRSLWLPFVFGYAFFSWLLFGINEILPFIITFFLSIIGWKQSYKVIFTPLSLLILTIASISALEPVWFIDSLNYQMRIPRDLNRTGMAAIDGTSFHQTFLNPIHLLIASHWLNEGAAKAVAIIFQAMCLIFTIELIGTGSCSQKMLALGYLGIPLTWILACVEGMDHFAIFSMTFLVLNSWKNLPLRTRDLFGFGLLWWIKPTPFVIAFPFILIYLLRHRRPVFGAAIISIPLLVWLSSHFLLFGCPGFPYYFSKFGHTDFSTAYNAYARFIQISFHGSSTLNTMATFIYIIPFALMILLVRPSKRSIHKLLGIIGAIIIWAIVIPQIRFGLYLTPVLLSYLWSHLNSKKHRQLLLILVSVMFIGRGLPFILHQLKNTAQRINHPKQTLVPDFSQYLSSNSTTYIERSYGWNLPGRAIVDKTWQFAWTYDRPWLEQMKETGVTHLLLKVRGDPWSKQFYLDDPEYQKIYLLVEAKRVQAVEKVRIASVEISSNGDWTLYKLP